MAEARRHLPQFLAETDLLIAQAKGTVDPVQKIRSLLPEELQGHDSFDVVQENTRLPAHIEVGADQWIENPEFIELFEIVKAKKAGTYKQPRTAQELITLATTLKQPARATLELWERHLGSLMDCAGKQYITELTEEDVLTFRDDQLQRIAVSSLKTKLRYIRALMELAKDQKWITSNPADGAAKHLKTKQTLKQVVRLDQADAHWQELPEQQQLLWHLCRWTGAHISEVAGLRLCDVDLSAGLIKIVPTPERPLKNFYRERAIPVHPNLLPYLKKGIAQGSSDNQELLFPWAYNPERQRWCEGISWKRKLGITPKATRDWATSCLRGKGCNERIIGMLLGHSPTKEGITGVYGSADEGALRRAIEMLE